MPTYEYRCPKGHQFEVFQRISAEPGAPCPECGEEAQRQISAGAGFLFKGDGFYITDSRSADYKKRASSESPSSDSGSAKSDSGSAKADSGPAKSDSGSKSDSKSSGSSSSSDG